MKLAKAALMAVALIAWLWVFTASGQAAIVNQWASSVIDSSSYYNLDIDPNSWAPTQALGEPNTFTYDDNVTAWAPLADNGTREWLTLRFDTPVYAQGVTIRETYGNGFVYQVDVMDQSNNLHTVWTGLDSSQPGEPVNFTISFSQTPYRVNGVKIYTDTDHDLNAWEEIDAVRLTGSSAPLPSTLVLLGSGIAGLLALRWRRKQHA